MEKNDCLAFYFFVYFVLPGPSGGLSGAGFVDSKERI
jgi:hypothetical protein